jgi:hypothetical protein
MVRLAAMAEFPGLRNFLWVTYWQSLFLFAKAHAV